MLIQLCVILFCPFNSNFRTSLKYQGFVTRFRYGKLTSWRAKFRRVKCVTFPARHLQLKKICYQMALSAVLIGKYQGKKIFCHKRNLKDLTETQSKNKRLQPQRNVIISDSQHEELERRKKDKCGCKYWSTSVFGLDSRAHDLRLVLKIMHYKSDVNCHGNWTSSLERLKLLPSVKCYFTSQPPR